MKKREGGRGNQRGREGEGWPESKRGGGPESRREREEKESVLYHNLLLSLHQCLDLTWTAMCSSEPWKELNKSMWTQSELSTTHVISACSAHALHMLCTCTAQALHMYMLP